MFFLSSRIIISWREVSCEALWVCGEWLLLEAIWRGHVLPTVDTDFTGTKKHTEISCRLNKFGRGTGFSFKILQIHHNQLQFFLARTWVQFSSKTLKNVECDTFRWNLTSLINVVGDPVYLLGFGYIFVAWLCQESELIAGSRCPPRRTLIALRRTPKSWSRTRIISSNSSSLQRLSRSQHGSHFQCKSWWLLLVRKSIKFTMNKL